MLKVLSWLRKERTGQTHVWPVFLVLVSILISYQNSFNVPRQFDDLPHQHLMQAGAYEPLKLWQYSRPIPLATLWIQYRLHQDWLVPYHVFNLSVHFFSSLLVYLLAVQLLKRKNKLNNYSVRLSALSIALIFAIHPLQTQAVTYIIQRMASMAALFFLLGVNLFLFQNLVRAEKKLLYSLLVSLLVILAGIAAFFSKENAVVFPAILLLATILFFPIRLKLRSIRNPLFSIVILMVLFIGLLFFRKNLSVYPTSLLFTPIGENLTKVNYGLTQLSVLPRYFGQLVIPIRQNIDHAVPITTAFGVRPALGLFVIFALILIIVLMCKKNPIAAFGLSWFLLTMLVESSIFPINDVYVEHRLYLPIVGLLLSLLPALYKITESGKNARLCFLCILACIAVVLIMLTYRRNIVWQTELSLWSDSAKNAPQNPRAHYNVAVDQLGRSNPELAASELLLAIEANPKYHRAYNNLGAMMFQIGEYQLAAKYFKMALSFNISEELYDRNLNRAIEYLDNPESTSPPPEMAGAMYH